MNYKKIAKIFVTLGVVYWILLMCSALTGCKITEPCEGCESCKGYIDEYNISLDPMDKEQWYEREEFLRQFENH